MTILSGGNVGIGTTGPEAALHLKSNTTWKPNLILENQTDDDSAPKLKFVKDSAGPEDGDACGYIQFFGDYDGGSESQFGSINCKATDVSAGAEYGLIQFRTMTSGTLGSSDLVVSGGNVGIGTTSPAAYLDVVASDLSALFGSDEGANATLTNSTQKTARIGLPHYLNAEESAALWLMRLLAVEACVVAHM